MISRRTRDIFHSWHDGEPSEVRSIGAEWAHYYRKVAEVTRVTYFSKKWSTQVNSPQGDRPATYQHDVEGAPCYLWVPDPDGQRLSLPGDVAKLGDALEVNAVNDEEEFFFRWERGQAHLVAMSRSKIAVIPRGARIVPIVITNTKVTRDGLDDY